MIIYFYAIISVLAVSAVSLVGIFVLSLSESVLRKYLFLLVSLAVGTLIGDAFLHLIPQAFGEVHDSSLISLGIIAGILIFFLLEKVLHWHHHDTDSEVEHAVRPTGRIILVSDAVHNFIDGLIIGASYLVSIEVGIATTLAIMLHEIPQEIGDFGVLLYAGYSRGRALFVNFLSALTAFFGTLLALLLGNATEALVFWLVPLAAGGFIYIAMSDLIPEIHKTKYVPHSVLQFLAILMGIGIMTLLLLVE